MTTAVRVEMLWDDEARNWHYRVPALHINGGGAASRYEALSQAADAIAFALQGDPADYDDEAEVASFDVSVTPPPGRSTAPTPPVATAWPASAPWDDGAEIDH